MLYIQITTFFGSQSKFKISCLRPNCCAARKMRFQLFFFPQSTSSARWMVIFTPGVCPSQRSVAPAALEERRLGLLGLAAFTSMGKMPLNYQHRDEDGVWGSPELPSWWGQLLSPLHRAAFSGAKAGPLPAQAPARCKRNADCQTGASAARSPSCPCR